MPAPRKGAGQRTPHNGAAHNATARHGAARQEASRPDAPPAGSAPHNPTPRTARPTPPKPAKAATDARALCLTVLQQVHKGMAVQAALDSALTAARDRVRDLPDACAHFTRDKALCTELVYGVLRTQIRLDHILDRFLKKPASVPLLLRLCMDMTLYSVYFLERVPDHAAVHWAVDYARARFGARMAAMTNAVLRAVLREGEAPTQAAYFANADSVAALSAFYAMPAWICRLWLRAYGAEVCELLLRRSLHAPYTCLRCNPHHEGWAALVQGLCDAGGEALCAAAPQSASDGNGTNDAVSSLLAGAVAFAPGHTPAQVGGVPLGTLHDEGAFSWQAAGSLAALAALGPWDAPVWDACAGQGGKTLALLDAGVPVGLCSDVHSGRLRQLMRTAHRLEHVAPPVVCASATAPPVAAWRGDILLDVPCSGLGTLARRPDIRLRRQPEDLDGLCAVQRAMLEAVWPLVPRGRRVVYMTCTLVPRENEEQVRAFVDRHADAVCTRQWQTPHEHPWLEGMFAASICKQ